MTDDGGMALRDVIVDSSLLYGAATRRFIMNLWELDDLRVPVLPKGVDELYGILRASEGRYWDTRFRREAERTGRKVPAEIRSSVRRRAVDAIGEWVNEEMGRNEGEGRPDSSLQSVVLTPDQHERASEIAERIPLICFHGTSPDNHMGDRSLVGQCLAAGFRIFAAENRKMMARNRINSWLRESGHANEDVVLNGDDAIERAGLWRNRPNELLEAALRAALPRERRETKREDEIVTSLLVHLREQGMPLTAQACLDAWMGRDMPDIYDRARAFIADGDDRARATEQRRIDSRDRAAASAGYGR